MIPSSISREHVLPAIEQVSQQPVPRQRESRDFDLVLDDGRRLPPKYVVAVAGLLATGRMLGSEEFEGGAETNGFLQRLGFRIEAEAGGLPRAAPRPDSPPTRPLAFANPVRVARATLNMAVSPADFRAIAASAGDAWAAHRRIVTGQYRADPASYRSRLTKLAEHAASHDADVLVLPACAIVHDAGEPLTQLEEVFGQRSSSSPSSACTRCSRAGLWGHCTAGRLDVDVLTS